MSLADMVIPEIIAEIEDIILLKTTGQDLMGVGRLKGLVGLLKRDPELLVIARSAIEPIHERMIAELRMDREEFEHKVKE